MAAVWEECLAWFGRCGLKIPSKVSADLLLFSDYLRDGVLLCHLLHLLERESVQLYDSSAVYLHPCMIQCLCARNVKTFLSTCRSKFQLRENDLFEFDMLFDLTDFGRVLHTLSCLSRSPKTSALGIKGFEAAGLDKQPMYEDLSLNKRECNLALYSIFSPTRDNVYDLITTHRKLSYIEIKEADQFSNPIAQAVRTIVEREKNYVDLLYQLDDTLGAPLALVLPAKQHATIFYKNKELIEVHQRIRDELIRASASGDGCTVYRVFLKWEKKLRFYQRYAVNLPIALDAIARIHHNDKQLAKEIEHREFNVKGKFNLKLSDLVQRPLQQIELYSSSLEELSALMPSNHPDIGGVNAAGRIVSEIDQHIKISRDDSYIVQAIEEIEMTVIRDWSSSGNPPLVKCGRLFKDGLLKVSIDGQSRSKYRLFYVFLFSRSIVFCRPQKTALIQRLRDCWTKKRDAPFYNFESKMDLQNFVLEESSWRVSNRPWRVVDRIAEKGASFIARTEEDRTDWIKYFKRAILQLHPDVAAPASHQYRLQTFDSSTINCDVCLKNFRGLLDQGYQCKTCGQSSHEECLQNWKQCQQLSSAAAHQRPGTMHSADHILLENWLKQRFSNWH